MVNIKARYAAEKVGAAYDILASLTVSAPRRIAGAMHEISLLSSHQDQLSERGRELYLRIEEVMNVPGSWEATAEAMSEGERNRFRELLRDLFYETQSTYYGIE
jgi:hypothetical protein